MRAFLVTAALLLAVVVAVNGLAALETRAHQKRVRAAAATFVPGQVLLGYRDRDERRFQQARLEVIPPPRLVAFGSSRVMPVSTALVGGPPGAFYNTGLSAASVEDVIVLWPKRDGEPAAAELAERLRSQIRPYVGPVSIGLGPPCTAVTEYGDAYRLAAGALDLVQRAGQRDRVVALGDLGIYRLLLQVKRPEELVDFMHGVLRPLYEYDGRRDTTLLFLCRSAVRSHHAAASAATAGFSHAFNVLEGFEGDGDDRRQRGHLGGWRKAGLPWIQD